MKKFAFLSISFSIIFFLSFTSFIFSQQSVEYEVIQISIAGTLGFSINDSSEVVGRTWDGGTPYSFLWKNFNLTLLSPLADAIDINNNAEIVGYIWHDPTYWHDGTIINLGLLPNTIEGSAYSINDYGKIVGICLDDTGGYHPFLFDGAMQPLALPINYTFAAAMDINNSNVIVGYSKPAIGIGKRATRWVNGNPEIIDVDSRSGAFAINNNNVIVGWSGVGPSELYFPAKWENGMLSFLDLLPGAESGDSRAINDSLEIVGNCYGNVIGYRAFVWKDGITRDLNNLIPADSNITLTGASSINNKGQIICGGVRSGEVFCFLLKPIKINITSPVSGDKWIAGETDTIRWTGGKANEVIKIKYSTDAGNNFELLDAGINATDTMYVWDIPDTLIGRRSLIRIERNSTSEILAESDTFKIKPYIITRVDNNGNYVKYDINTDRWGFGNDSASVWPGWWYARFNYQGTDPFTNKHYSRWQGDSIFVKAKSSDHPDWESFVKTFGTAACYADTYIGIYNPDALLKWKSVKGKWGGSCFGMAISNALAFSYKNEFLNKYSNFPDSIIAHNVVSDTNVIPVINELFTHQYGNPHDDQSTEKYYNKTPNQTLNDLRKILREDDTPVSALSIWKNIGDGGHTILPYQITGTGLGAFYFIKVHDNANPDDLSAEIDIDTSANGGLGSWYYFNLPDWGGNGKIIIEDSAYYYLTKPILPRSPDFISPFILAENILHINNSNGPDIIIQNNLGEKIGHTNNALIEELPGAVPKYHLNRSETPPYGYSVPIDNYSVVLNNFSADTLNTFFFTGNKSFEYERYGATQTQTDRLFFDGGVSVVNPDQQKKTIKLLNIINETTQEKLFVVRHLDLLQNDSVKIENVDNDKLKLTSYGSAKDYGIGLEYTSESNFGLFSRLNFQLSANTTHTFIPNWSDITNSNLAVYVDIGNNGTIDDTLYLQNQVTSVGEDQGSLIPTEYRLEQNYPNPFNNSTVIRYSIPKEGIVSLKIYNAIGEEVTAIVNEVKQPGNYEVTFNTEQLPSGVYFCRLQAGDFVQTRKMILLK